MIKKTSFSGHTDGGVSGEMLMVGAVAIAFSLMTAAALSATLFNINVQVLSERSHSLLHEFRVLKTKMEQALQYKLSNFKRSEEDRIYENFLKVEENFSRIELCHGIYFNAVIETIHYDAQDEVSTIDATVVMRQQNSEISGNITFSIQ
ncbi:MAG TPA: hypothetical protein ENI45_03750 [Thermoplasmatales archaeon]|nr:hypothetical protein [Thermoplasmatales archaeon]